MTDEQKYDLIERYLDQKLSSTERADFERTLKDNPDLRTELKLHEQLAETLQGDEIHELRAALKNINEKWESSKEEKKVRSLPFRRIAAIAAAVLFILIGYQFFKSSVEPSPVALVTTHFEPYKMVMNQRAILSETITDAVNAYEEKDFVKAAAAFRTLKGQNEETIVYPFYLAICELALENTSEAISLFENILQQDDHLFVQQSRWYLALAYLKNDNVVKAKTLLQSIQPDEFQYATAQEIIDQL